MSQRIVETKQRMIQQRRKALRAVLRLCGVGMRGNRRAAVVALLVMQMLMSWPVMSMQEKPPAKEKPPSKSKGAGKVTKRPARTRPAPKIQPPSVGRQAQALAELRDSFVKIPAGEFMMGSETGDADEKPAHRVRISQGFEIGKYEVTQAQWQAVMGSNPSYFKGANLPVEQVSWDDAQQFIQRLNARNDGYVYRLPTEAEWEYACRAGTTTAFAFGDSLSSEQANFDGNSPYGSAPKGKYLQRTVAVGSYQPNAWGLYDMHGNVWEWCQDWYSENYYTESLSVDPQGPATGSLRVTRGGGWGDAARNARSAHRDGGAPGDRYDNLGFRLLRTYP